MPDPKKVNEETPADQARRFLAHIAPSLALVLEPLKSFGQQLPEGTDWTPGATLARIAYLELIAACGYGQEEIDGAVAHLSRRLSLRPATREETAEVEELADLAGAPLSTFGPRRVLGSVPDLGGRRLEDLEAEAEAGRGVGALIRVPGDEDGGR